MVSYVERKSFTVLIIPVINARGVLFAPGKIAPIPSSRIIDPDFAVFQLHLALFNDKITTKSLGLTNSNESISELRITYVFDGLKRIVPRYMKVPVFFKIYTENLDGVIELDTYYEIAQYSSKNLERLECREIGIRELLLHDIELARIWLCDHTLILQPLHAHYHACYEGDPETPGGPTRRARQH
jgi:hypothetical protein